MRRFAVLLLLAACTGSDVDPGAVSEDAPEGDSLDPEGKADGFTVPRSLDIDKNRVVYLTFDDGPSPIHTPKILDVLARHGAKATFFITGAAIAGNEAIIKRAAREGHIIASHQWSHVIASSSQFRGWVRKERDLLATLAPDQPRYFRYPYGAMAAWKEQILREEGYLDGGVGWDIDTLDWDFGPDGRAARAEVPVALRGDFEGWIFYQLGKRSGGVMLFHDVQSITASRLDALLTRLAAEGYTVGELPRVRRWVGQACGEDADCAVAGGFCGPSGLCTTACTSSCGDMPGFATTRCVVAPAEDDESIQVCAASCGTGCAEGTCQTLVAPSGVQRAVCW